MNISEIKNTDHKAKDLINIFNGLFEHAFSTVLEGGGEEPIYLPANDLQNSHRIIFTQDYFASALHEISHWCIAGESRRQQVDYGYWYEPDGRSLEQQSAFESVEVEPQALEWLFSVAAGIKFRVSADNLNGGDRDTADFSRRVKRQVAKYITNGLTGRAAQFCLSLIEFYNRESAFEVFCNEVLKSQPLEIDEALTV